MHKCVIPPGLPARVGVPDPSRGKRFRLQNISGTLCVMQNSRDSSVWRTLAVAFGDGLAFGVGVTLTRSAARFAANRGASPAPAMAPAPKPVESGWPKEVPRRTAAGEPSPVPPPRPVPVSNPPIEAALASIRRRVAETGGQIDRRL